jgi:hypothetical protein
LLHRSYEARGRGQRKQEAKQTEDTDHDLPDSGGRDPIPFLGLLELLDGDGGTPTAGRRVRRLEPREEDEAVGALPDLSHQLVLLQPRRAVRAAAGGGTAIPHPRRRS